MAFLRSLRTGKPWPLCESSRLGRAQDAWIQLQTPCASARHAEIAYCGDRWMLFDRSSRNGTWIDGRRIGTLGSELRLGQQLRLGSEEGEVFEVIHLDRPEPIAVSADDGTDPVAGEDGVLSLPDGAATVMIHAVNDTWMVESEGRPAQPVPASGLLPLSTTTWQLRLPSAQAQTVEARDALSGVLLIRHSKAFEDLELGLRIAGEVRPLRPRSYALMLLVLAQARQTDHRDAVDAREAGWLEVPELLTQMSRGAPKFADRQQINTYRLRFERLMVKHGLVGDDVPMLERRLGSDRIRLAGPFDIVPL